MSDTGRRSLHGMGSLLLGFFAMTCAGKAPPPSQPAAAASPPGAALAKVPSLAPVPAAQARGKLLASITVPSLDRTLVTAAELGKRASPMPLDPVGVREMLLTQAGIPPRVAQALDTAQPVGAAVVSMKPRPNPAVVIALAIKGPPEDVVTALGRIVGERGEAKQIETPTMGNAWIWTSPGTLVAADTAEALELGLNLALEARAGGSEDVRVVLHPDAIAAHFGTTLQQALAGVSQALKMAAESAGGTSANKGAKLDIIDSLVAKLADAEQAEIGLGLDPATGARLAVRLHPRTGSALAAEAREARPFDVDLALLGGENLALAGASSFGTLARAQLESMRETVAAQGGKGASEAVRLLEAFRDAYGGPFTMAVRTKPSVAGEAAYGLADAGAAAKLATALENATETAVGALIASQTGPLAQLPVTKKKTEKVGGLHAVHYVLDLNVKGVRPKNAAAVQKALGGAKVDFWGAVAGTRLLVTMGADAKARLAALASRSSGPPAAPDMAAALAEVKGREGFVFLEIASLARLGASFSPDPNLWARAPARVHAPIFMSWGGDGQGQTMSFELRAPLAAFTGIGEMLQGATAAGSAN